MNFLMQRSPAKPEDQVATLKKDLAASRALVTALDAQLMHAKKRAVEAEDQREGLEASLAEARTQLEQAKAAVAGQKGCLSAELEYTQAEMDWQVGAAKIGGDQSAALLAAQQRCTELEINLKTAQEAAETREVRSELPLSL
jgi:chromosome segregation ATPase